MRIIAGQFRGLALVPVGKGDPAAHLRPTPDRVREALFSSLAARGAVQDAMVLDLFAGTGALGLEALSRGAARADFVENGRKALALLEGNIARTGSEDARVWKQDALKLGPAPAAFDLVFLDPPYGKSMGEKALVSAAAAGWLAPGALVIWEEEQPQEPPSGFRLAEHKRYGRAHLTFLEKA